MESIKTIEGFAALGISNKVLRALEEMGFEEPSPIQQRSIPLILQGKDVAGQAQTGTGKTAAFGVGIAEGVDPHLHQIQAIVLTPTRELCLQVSGEMAKITKYQEIKVLPVYGGQFIDRQIRALQHGVHVVIGTPGRVMDHLRRGTINLEQVKIAVLDEADEMLDMGFIEDIEFILSKISGERQTLLFSATMPEDILRLARRHQRSPQYITISPEKLAAPSINQVYYEVREQERLSGLCRVLDMEDIQRAIIFCRTKKGSDEVAEALQARGYLAEAIHGDLSQVQRNRVMKRFREGNIELLVATDVAARGLDIENLTHVLNYDLPQDPESYVHRIGRTGRAGKTGEAISFINSREWKQIKLIERTVKVSIQRVALPTLADLAEKQQEELKGKVEGVIAAGGNSQFKEMSEELLAQFDPAELVAAILQIAFPADRDKERKPVEFGDTGAAEAGMVRLFVNAGRAQNVQPADIVRAVAGGTGIPGSLIGVINIYDRFTFVEVPSDVASKVLESMREATIKGRPINVEPARARE